MKKLRRKWGIWPFLALALFAVLIVVSVLFCTPAHAESLVVVVMDDKTKAPIKGAEVCIRIYDEKHESWQSVVCYCHTNSLGVAIIPELETGQRLVIGVTARGYLPAFYKNKLFVEIPDVLEVGSSITKVEMRLSSDRK